MEQIRGMGSGQQSCSKSPVNSKQTFQHSPAGGARDPGGCTLGSMRACPPVLVIGRKNSYHPSPSSEKNTAGHRLDPNLPVSPLKAQGSQDRCSADGGLQERGRKSATEACGDSNPTLPAKGTSSTRHKRYHLCRGGLVFPLPPETGESNGVGKPLFLRAVTRLRQP